MVSYKPPEGGDEKGAQKKKGEWEAKTEAGKLYLARYGGLIEDYKVIALGLLIIRAGGPAALRRPHRGLVRGTDPCAASAHIAT